MRPEQVRIGGIIDRCFGDDRMIVVLLSEGNDARINETPIQLGKIPDLMKQIMAYRESRCVFVVPSNDTPFQHLVNLNEHMHMAVPDLHVYVIRKEILEQSTTVAVGAATVLPAVPLEEWPDPRR
jgi:hypothetical protein